ncbi:MAG: hypothetical protein ACRCZS_06600 [Chroococcidiopsis sp.]
MTESQFWQWLIEKAYEYKARQQLAQPPPPENELMLPKRYSS